MVPGLIVLILAFSFVLIKSSEQVIIALRRISRKTKAGVFILSAIILALGTSLPEFFVGITSAFADNPTLSFGNIIGANIANLALVVGIAGLITGKVHVDPSFTKRDIFVAFGAGILPALLIWDNEISRADGLILISAYAAYAGSLFKLRFNQISHLVTEEKFIVRFWSRFSHIETSLSREMIRLFGSIAVMIFAADMIVRFSKTLAGSAGIPIFFVGLVILSIGTTLPELIFSVRSLESHQPSMFFGNILGSIIVNSTFILGVVSLISPIKIVSINGYFTALGFFVLIFLVFWFFIRSKFILERKEAFVLIALYIGFIVTEIYR